MYAAWLVVTILCENFLWQDCGKISCDKIVGEFSCDKIVGEFSCDKSVGEFVVTGLWENIL